MTIRIFFLSLMFFFGMTGAEVSAADLELKTLTPDINSKILEAIAPALKKDYQSTLLTEKEAGDFFKDDEKCAGERLPEQCYDAVEQRKRKLIDQRKKDLVRLAPPKLELTIDEYVARTETLPDWHPEKRAQQTVAMSIAKLFVKNRPELRFGNESPEAAGKECLVREEDLKIVKVAREITERSKVVREEEMKRKAELLRISRIEGEPNPFASEQHRNLYRARLDEHVQRTEQYSKDLNSWTSLAFKEVQDTTWRHYEADKQQLDRCRASPSDC